VRERERGQMVVAREIERGESGNTREREMIDG